VCAVVHACRLGTWPAVLAWQCAIWFIRPVLRTSVSTLVLPGAPAALAGRGPAAPDRRRAPRAQGAWPPGSQPARGGDSIAIDSPFRPADADADCADVRARAPAARAALSHISTRQRSSASLAVQPACTGLGASGTVCGCDAFTLLSPAKKMRPRVRGQVGGDPVQLQRLTLEFPAGHDLAGLIFVIRSADATAWWRDGVSRGRSARLELGMLLVLERPLASCRL